jgi:hypothetical protein
VQTTFWKKLPVKVAATVGEKAQQCPVTCFGWSGWSEGEQSDGSIGPLSFFPDWIGLLNPVWSSHSSDHVFEIVINPLPHHDFRDEQEPE